MDSYFENAVNNVNTTAMVLGYPVLAILVFLAVWFGSRIFRALVKLFDEMKYDRWKRRHSERDWDNIEASWMLELDEDNREPYIPVQRNQHNRHDTIELPEDFAEQLYNYREERR
jgi:hypothetical protein